MDTKKVYIPNGKEFIPMGGNSGIYYGTMTLTDTPNEGQVNFDFTAYDIEGNDGSSENASLPNVDDLILNHDGCFYRVLEIDGKSYNATIRTKKLTLAGGGGGGGGTGGGPGSGTASLNVPSSELSPTILKGASYALTFNYKAVDGEGEPTGSGKYVLKINRIQKKTGTVHQGENKIDISEFLTQASDEPYEVRLEVEADIGAINPLPLGKTWRVKVVEMNLTWNYDESKINKSNEQIPISWKVSGQDLEKTTRVIIDDAHTVELSTSLSGDIQNAKIDPSKYFLTHGVHKFEMYAVTDLDGKEARTDSVFKNIILAEEGNTIPIISVGLFKDSLTQYNTINIPVILYKADNELGNAEIILKENGETRDTWTDVKNGVVNTWSYTPTKPGINTLSVQCGSVEAPIVIDVIKLDIDNEEVADYAFKFKASDFSSNNAIQSWEENGTTITFSEKFDWINGGLKTEKDEFGGARQYLAIKAGSTATINYPLFERSAKNGKTIKIIFKSANCRDYDAHVLSCKKDKKVIFIDKDNETLLQVENGTKLNYAEGASPNEDYSVSLINPKEGDFSIETADARTLFDGKFVSVEGKIYQCHFAKVEGEEDKYYAYWYPISAKDSFEGLSINAQYAEFNSRSNTISTQFCEDRYIELELDISRLNGAKSYIKFWVDGVPSGFVVYKSDDDFTGPEDRKITIGSVDCDTYIYMIKVYEKSLTDNEHLENFIADALNAEEMMRRYRRNDILNSSGVIDPQRLAVANPDCLVHVYQIDRMTKTKKDKVTGCTYDQYHGSNQIALHADNVTIKVQGTSSEKYVVAAANIDSEFKNGFEDLVNNKHLDGWSMDGGKAIPCDYFCTKVNVASCENANNALNQEWYNIFQPYKTVLSFKNKNARDTMQFTNGVLFLKDLNKTFKTDANADKKENNVFGEIEGYISENMASSAYPRLYSLANMGNSKDNVHVFHDTTNPLECCIEVGDNQTQQQWMVSDDYNKSDIGEDEKYFEFRYPDGIDGVKERGENGQRMIDGWNSFVSWMAHSNPQPKYQEHKATNEKEFRAFAFNQKTQKDVPVYIMNEDRTAYTLIEAFDSSIDTYYTETEHIYGYTNLKLPDTLTADERTFEPYTFRGFKAENQVKEDGTLWQAEYNPMIKGCTISTYALKNEAGEYIPYEYDTYEYRMAKMLSECEDHLVMDSVIFHYLFIERHCMIDNVAKNTFWSTEDCQHWFLNKDYDNDTADGNDNNGKFTRTYGMEVMDKLNANVYVFNARQSVWLNFIHGLRDAREWMYQALEAEEVEYNGKKLSVWSKDSYLELFKEWQSIIPERCWIEDYYRKYFRPYELYNDTMFISMMEGGQKSHQRAQYETYQETYMSSEYNGIHSKASEIKIRPNGSGMLNYELPVTTYSDCYIRMDLGSQSSSRRVKRNELAHFICPQDNLNNATMYLYPAKAISTLGSNEKNLGYFTPEQLSFTGAGKLRELILSTEDSPKNESLKEGLSINNNILLEKLAVANFGSYGQGLDLSGCPNLLELNARGSSFTSVQIANNAPVTSIKLENPTSLNLSNLSELQELDIKDASRLSGLIINNIDNSEVNSKDIVEKTYNNNSLERYKLTNINWTMSDEDDVDESAKTVRLLEYLLTKKTVEEEDEMGEIKDIPKAAALTGQLLITEDAYNENASEEIYNKYVNKDTYPSLNIDFNGSAAELFDINVYDANGKIYWSKKILKNKAADEEFYSDGPYGTFVTPETFEDPQYIYIFKGKWTIHYTNGNPSVVIEGNKPIIKHAITCDLNIEPVFEKELKEYKVTIYNEQQVLFETTANYGVPLSDIVVNLFPYRDDSKLAKEQTYKFLGYAASEKYAQDLNLLENLNKIYITGDCSYWTAFKPVSVYDNIIDEKYLSFNVYKNGYEVGLKDTSYAAMLKGKITLPTTHSNRSILKITESGFRDCKNVTMFFFEKENNLIEELGQHCFYGASSLIYFDMPENVKIISTYSFYNCGKLFNDYMSNEDIIKFFKNIEGIENRAFVSNNGRGKTFYFPGKLKYIGEYGFRFCEMDTVEFGSTGDPSQFDPSLQNIVYGIFAGAPYLSKVTVYAADTSLPKWDEMKNQIGNIVVETPEGWEVLNG